jgi:hypothetical protein
MVEQTTCVVIPFRRAEREAPPPNPPSEAAQPFTVTIEYPDGRRLRYSAHGNNQVCDGLDTDSWYGPEVRDLQLLAHAQTYLAALICEAAE